MPDLPILTPTESIVLVAFFLAIGWIVLMRLFYPKHDIRIVKPEEPVLRFPFDAWEQAQKETRENVVRFKKGA